MKMLILFLSAILVTSTSFSQAELRARQFNLDDGIAIKGYDPVAYFTENKAVQGKKQVSYTYEGVTYYFKNTDNREKFIKTPKMFEPQYGGWCAYTMSRLNEKEDIDPRTFKIVNGKLYLFYRTLAVSALKKWNTDEERLKPLGDINWTAMFK